MAIDRFDIGRFEGALPKHNQTGQALWKYLGMQKGERLYMVPAGKYARVMVRSSIDETGYAAETGKDSIRLWLEIYVNGNWKAIRKMDTYTTRVSGWEDRMIGKIRELYKLGVKIKRDAGKCDKCGNDKMIVWFVKKEGPNFERPAMKCPQCNEMHWLDQDAPVVTEDGKEEKDNPQQEMDINDFLANIGEEKDVLDQVGDVLEHVEERVKTPDPQQELAILAPADRPCRVLAAAGSGKTFVIERRYQYLLAQGVRPEEIIVVTFSKAQSQDMAERIMKLNPQIRGTDGENQICTIHAFCSRALHKHRLGRNIPQKSWETKRWIQEESKRLWPITDEKNKSQCRPAWDEILSAIYNAKSRFLAESEDYELYEHYWGSYHAERLSKIRAAFDQWMRGRKEWTFIDMLYDMEWNMSYNEGFRKSIQDSIKYIMIDEAQDTNGQAMRILKMVAEPEDQVFIVGDPDQLLYRFTGAEPEANCYEGFDERYPAGLTFKLETNYRSTKEVVAKGHELIRHNYWDIGPYDFDFFKSVNASPSAMQGPEVGYKFYKTQQEEADAVADTIVELLQNGANPSDIFVSSRTRAQLGVLEPVLTECGVPFVNITGGSFWLLGHVQKLIAWPKLVYDHTDGDALAKIVNIASKNFTGRDGEYSPTRFLGRAFVEYCDGIYDRDMIMRSGDHRGAWYYGASDFVDMMDELEEVAKTGTHADVMNAALVHYEKHLRVEEGALDDNEDIGKMDDLRVVVDVAAQFDTWEEFLEKVEEAIQAAEDSKNKNWEKYVVLSTVHRLKGMERPIMFGIGWCEGDDIGLLPHTFSLGVKPPSGILDFGGEGKIEDERCIAYVCVTRAQQRVFLSGFENFRNKVLRPSRFAKEMTLAREYSGESDYFEE